MNLIVVFLQKAIAQGIAILYGANGEIVTEKSGNLNLGVPGMMYMGGVAGLMGAFLYENSVEAPVPFVGMLIALVCALVCSGLGALIYSVLTISLRANQNVTGLALTTFGMGVANFFGVRCPGWRAAWGRFPHRLQPAPSGPRFRYSARCPWWVRCCSATGF